jgi:hypothetical protein
MTHSGHCRAHPASAGFCQIGPVGPSGSGHNRIG